MNPGEMIEATEPPETWKPPAQSRPKATGPLTKAQVIAVLKRQVNAWRNRARSAPKDEIDNLMESNQAYRLVADMAQLCHDLVERIP